MAILSNSSAIINQFVHPFKKKGEYFNNQILMFDPQCQAFVNVDYTTLSRLIKNELDQVFESIEYYFELGNGAQSAYVLPWAAISKESLVITLDGVKQLDQAYSIQVIGQQTVVTFAEVIPLDMQIEVLGFQIMSPRRILRYTTGQLLQTTTSITIPWIASTEQSLLITIDGVKQHVMSYDFTWQGNNTTTITFSSPVPANSEIEVLGFYGFNAGLFRFAVYQGDGVEDTFSAPWYVADPKYLYITIDGIKQHQNAFSVTVNNLGITEIVFAEPVPNGSNVELFSFDPRLLGCTQTCGGLTATNLGTGAPVMNSVTQNSLGMTDISFRTIVAGDGIALTVSPSTITIRTDLPDNSIDSIGSGISLLDQQSGQTGVKSVLAGDGVVINDLGEEIEISVDTTSIVNEIISLGGFAQEIRSVGNPLLQSVSLVKKGTSIAPPLGIFELYGLRPGVGINITKVENDIVISDKNGGNYVQTTNSIFVGLDENFVGVRAGTDVTVTLPDLNVVGVGKMITVKDELGNAGMLLVRVQGLPGQLIDGSNFYDLEFAREAITVYASNSGWHIVSRYRP